MMFPKNAAIRLKGDAMLKLRLDMWDRDTGRCCDCGEQVSWFDTGERTGEMAHIRSRGANGSDTLENVRLLCRRCHRNSHNCGGKPCPPKPKM